MILKSENEFHYGFRIKKELEQHKKNRIHTVSLERLFRISPEKEDIEKMKNLSIGEEVDDRVEKTELEKIINSEIDINIRAIKKYVVRIQK